MKLVAIAGTRPEVIKLAPVIIEARKRGHEIKLIATGQHPNLQDLAAVFNLKISKYHELFPDALSVKFGATLINIVDDIANADWVFVQGDTYSALSGAIAAFYSKIKLCHVEAGLRTYNRQNPWPEESNRRMISHMADLHACPTEGAANNIFKETISGTITTTGNTVVDALRYVKIEKAEEPHILITAHRRENWDHLAEICFAVDRIAELHPEYRIKWPVHPNPDIGRVIKQLLGAKSTIDILPPQPYEAFVNLMAGSKIILTDSGGVQEEAPRFNVPVLVMRKTTERPEGIEAGCSKLVGSVPADIISAAHTLLTDDALYHKMSTGFNPYGDGHAAERILDAIEQFKGAD